MVPITLTQATSWFLLIPCVIPTQGGPSPGGSAVFPHETLRSLSKRVKERKRERQRGEDENRRERTKGNGARVPVTPSAETLCFHVGLGQRGSKGSLRFYFLPSPICSSPSQSSSPLFSCLPLLSFHLKELDAGPSRQSRLREEELSEEVN